LAGAYRSALAEVVATQEKLDRLRLSLGKGDANPADLPPAMGPTHFVVGSSRHRMVARLAPNLNIIAVTSPLRTFLGRSIRELLARSFLELTHPEDAEAVRAALGDAVKDGEAHNISFRVVLPPSIDQTEGSPPGERFLQMDVMTCYDEHAAPLHL